MHIGKCYKEGAKDSPKEVGDPQKVFQVKMARKDHKWDELPTGNNNLLPHIDISPRINVMTTFIK